MQNENINTHPRVATILSIFLIIIIPLIIAIFSTIAQITSFIPVEEALKSNVSKDVAQFIANQDEVNINKVILREVKHDGNWIAVVMYSTNPDNFGNGALIVLQQQQDGSYQKIYLGAGYDKSTLTSKNIPDDLAAWLTNPENIDKYSNVINDSYIKPQNQYPILNDLPYQTDRLSITYYFEDNLKDANGTSIPIIKISGANAAERSNALDKIRRLGYDPGDYYIKFANLKNPFVEEPAEEIIEIDTSKENQGP